MANDSTSLSGNWQSFYRYQSSGRGDADFWGRHVLAATQRGKHIHLQSVPASKSELVIELELSPGGKSAAGTWREHTEQGGYYKGAVYEGTIELELSPDGQRLSGTWHGAGKDGQMNTGIWELTKNGVEQPE